VSRSVSAADAVAPLVDRLDYPLFVVTVSSPRERSGCLVGFVTQCSIQPPRYLICLSKENHTWDVSLKADALALHLLGREQGDVASVFGEETGDAVDKFAQVHWAEGVTGSPLLSECAAWMEGAIIDRIDVGDHVACVVDPVVGGHGGHPGQFTLSAAEGFEPGHPESSD
jgi:flavin reductase (DIM6/NTAB) family NADH-FMN oxidoreductase RutF